MPRRARDSHVESSTTRRAAADARQLRGEVNRWTQPSEHREAAAHDDRSPVEGRPERALRQFLRPAQYSDPVPLVLSVWHIPGEPTPVDEALRAAYEPFTTGAVCGKPWSRSWFRIEGRVPEERSGRRVEMVVDPGFTDDSPNFQAEGLCTTSRASPSRAFTRATGIRPSRRPRGQARPCGCYWKRPPTRRSRTASSLRPSGTC